MEIKKETVVSGSGVPTAEQLEAINAQARAEMTAQQVYVFSLRLCDDQVDRDGERFDTEALPALAKQYRETVREIEEIEGTQNHGDEISELIAQRQADGKPGAVRKDRSAV